MSLICGFFGEQVIDVHVSVVIGEDFGEQVVYISVVIEGVAVVSVIIGGVIDVSVVLCRVLCVQRCAVSTGTSVGGWM